MCFSDPQFNVLYLQKLGFSKGAEGILLLSLSVMR